MYFFIYKNYNKLKKCHYKIGEVAVKSGYMINIYQTYPGVFLQS